MTLSTCDFYFAFGPEPGSFVLDTPRTVRHSKAPYRIEKALREVKKVYWAVWNEKGHASFSLCTSRGVSEWISDGLDSDNPELAAILQYWLRRLNPEEVSLTLGPGDAYVMCLPTKNKVFYNGLNKNLATSLCGIDNVQHVALGIGGDFVIVSDGRVESKALDNYPELRRILAERSYCKVLYITLNPWRPEQYFVVLSDGTVYFKVDYSVDAAIRPVLQDVLGTIDFDSVSDGDSLYSKASLASSTNKAREMQWQEHNEIREIPPMYDDMRQREGRGRRWGRRAVRVAQAAAATGVVIAATATGVPIGIEEDCIVM